MNQPSASFGRFSNRSEACFDAWVRSSFYVPMRDGTRLAVDLMRPANGDVVAEEPLPAIWTHTRYQRASFSRDEKIQSWAEYWDPWLFDVIAHGYVALTVDVRGAGASFGINEGQYSAAETRDAYDMTEWIAAQSWCDGNVGMYGRSYLGVTQYFAASQAPPHLKAIFPEMASFDHYAYAFSGGVFRESSRFNWQLLVGNLDQSTAMLWKDDYQGPVVPVDHDDGELARALREHRANHDWYRMLDACQLRDNEVPWTGERLHQTRSAASFRNEIEHSGIPIYHLAGWYDMFPRDTLLWYANLKNPQKIVIGPWFHVDSRGMDYGAEHLRWYDHWLKGVDNGVMDEPAIHYWVIDAPAGQCWRATTTWPLPQATQRVLYLQNGPSHSIRSTNDGCLGNEMSHGADAYTVDYTTTSGQTNRWANANGGGTGYPDMTVNDEKGLTYTSAVLEEPLEVIGHPIVHLWISSTEKDGDFYAYLEDVHPDGFSQYVTEGVLRASHRALGEAPWNNLGLPFHSGLASDVEPLPDKPVELVFDLHPTAKHFPAGHRLRLSITCADCDNDRGVLCDPPAQVTVHRDAERASRLLLPVVDN